MYIEKRIEYATHTLERNIGFINMCDTKASIVLATIGVLITIFFSSEILNKISSIVSIAYKEKNFCSTLFLILFFISIFILMIGFKNLISVLIGRVNNISSEFKGVKYGSKIFFTDIVDSHKITTYKKDFLKMTNEDYLDELINQIYLNSKIASIKYQKYNIGLNCILSGFLSFTVLVLIGIFVY